MTDTSFVVTLTKIECGRCGGVYALCEKYRATCEQNSDGWHCPYCQSGWGYHGPTPAEKERRARVAVDACLDQVRAELRETESRRRAEKGAKTKIKNRIAAGLCPCCNRSFQNLARHMVGQHPEFTTHD